MSPIDAPRLPARAFAAACLAALLPGCAEVFYQRTGTGTFSGRLVVEWIEPNRFVYRPDADNPLTYRTSDGLEVRPRTMQTDGGSIPRLFWSTPLLGPWDFAPGYIVHDWLFQQHHCRTAGWEQVDFDRSASILAEAIKTQMERSKMTEPTVAWAIYEAVHSPAARTLWTDGRCTMALDALSAPPPGAKPVTIMTIAF